MKHELLYETQAQFNTAQGNSGNVTSIVPGVAFIDEIDSVRFNKTDDDVTIVYDVRDISTPTKMFNAAGVKTGIKEVFVDGTRIDIEDFTDTYQFEATGLHTVLIRYANLTTYPDSAFTQCTNIINIKLPDSLTKLGRYIFYGCTGFKKFVYPKNVRNIPAHCFHGCSNLERIYFKGVISINHTGDQGHQFQFQGCSRLKHVYFDSIQQICSGSFYGTKNEELFYHPCSQSKEGHLYIAGEEVFDIIIPEGVGSISHSNFAFYKYLTGVTFSSTITYLGYSAFYKCSGLRSLTLPPNLRSMGEMTFYGCSGITGDLVLPDTLTGTSKSVFAGCSGIQSLTLSSGMTSINDNVFQNCSSISNTLVIPSSITSIGQQAFAGCSSISGDLIIPDSVKSIGASGFSGCTNIENVVATALTADVAGAVFANLKDNANVTLKTTGWVWHSAIYPGVYNNVNLSCGGVTRGAGNRARVNNLIINGGGFTTDYNPGTARYNSPYDSAIIKVSGNLNAVNQGIYMHSGVYSKLKFFETMGSFTGQFSGLVRLETDLDSNGCIFHLVKNGIACNPEQVAVAFSRITKIYVGDGSSEESDQAIYDLYAEDTGAGGWNDQTEGGTSYMSKLDLWYNYHGEFREE